MPVLGRVEGAPGVAGISARSPWECTTSGRTSGRVRGGPVVSRRACPPPSRWCGGSAGVAWPCR